LIKVKTITKNPQEIAKTFNLCCLSAAETVIGKRKKDNNDPKYNVNPSKYLSNIFNATFIRFSWNNVTAYEIDKIKK
jgi:bifunctional pyridoxal-dependent enzyme with beta-cystathionase and maltose regulon repressor activities